METSSILLEDDNVVVNDDNNNDTTTTTTFQPNVTDDNNDNNNNKETRIDKELNPKKKEKEEKTLVCGWIDTTNNDNDTSSVTNHHHHCHPLLKSFHLYGWKPDEINLTVDENYMDLVLLMTRQQKEKNIGHCACLLVSSSSSSGYLCFGWDKIIGASANQSLFKEKTDCDIHAEISCLHQAHMLGATITNATAYITLPPCKPCFAALVQFGISRIVSRHLPSSPVLLEAAQSHNIDIYALSQDEKRRQMKRLNHLTSNTTNTDAELMEFATKRKQWRYQQKQARRQQKQQQQQQQESKLTSQPNPIPPSSKE